MYLAFSEYIAYGGTISDETTFNNFEFEASTLVDWYTFNRLQKMQPEEYPEALKRCMYALITYLQAQSAVDGTSVPTGESNSGVVAGIASQSNDGVSISYNVLSAQSVVENTKAKSSQIIRQYLANVKDSLGHKLLYRGIYPDE